jgi:hypothetical protein
MKLISLAFGWDRICKILLILSILSQPFFCVSESGAGGKLQGKMAAKPVQKSDKHLWNKTLDHPFRFTQSEFNRMASSLYFARKLPVAWAEPELIFDKKNLARLSQVFRKKLMTLQPNQTLWFSLKTPVGRTTGDVFVLGRALNWRFSEIKGLEYLKDFQSVAQESSGEILVNWKLVPQDNQEHFYKTNLLGMKIREETWLQVHIPPQNGNQRSTDAGEPAAGGKEEAAVLRNKLKVLKELKEDNLISEEDYRKKVQELLERF